MHTYANRKESDIQTICTDNKQEGKTLLTSIHRQQKIKITPTFTKTFLEIWKSNNQPTRHNPVIGNTANQLSRLRQNNEGSSKRDSL